MAALRISSSIDGIIASAGEVVNILGDVVAASDLKHAASLYAETANCQRLIFELKDLLDGPQAASKEHRAHVQIDHLVSVLTTGVLLFSDVESVVSMHSGGVSLWTRLQWSLKDTFISILLIRMDEFRGSIESIVDRLQNDADEKQSNGKRVFVSEEPPAFEDAPYLNGAIDNPPTYAEAVGIVPAISSYEQLRIDIGPVEESAINRANSVVRIEQDLASSRAYRTAWRHTMDNHSVTTSDPNTRAWSLFSDLSLADVSAVSVIALPLFRKDIANGHRYDFGPLLDLATSLPPFESETPPRPASTFPIRSRSRIFGHSVASSSSPSGPRIDPALVVVNGRRRLANGTWASSREVRERFARAVNSQGMRQKIEIPNDVTEDQRLGAQQRLVDLSNGQFEDLLWDVYDEWVRRGFATVWHPNRWFNPTTPTLPTDGRFSTQRNFARTKLSTLETDSFTLLLWDVYLEMKSRE